MKIQFLGTSGSRPTRDRGLTSIAIRREDELLLFDCGEGTQRQMTKTSLSPMKIDTVFLTHFHGDHFLGLPGLIQTMSLMNRERELEIVGPEGTSDRIIKLIDIPVFTQRFEVKTRELKPGEALERDGYLIKTEETVHSTPGLAYGLFEKERPGKFHPKKAKELGIEPGPKYSELQQGQTVENPDGKKIRPEDVMGPPRSGRKIVYSGDTKPSEKIGKFARGADVLVHDSTFGEDLKEEAQKGGHSTAKEAAEIAKRAGVERLILTHPSPRYSDASELEEEAKEIFDNSLMAEDFLKIEVELKD
ncbi:MAG: ribonuclease Z [Candidatus Hadarchaeia archaeon]